MEKFLIFIFGLMVGGVVVYLFLSKSKKNGGVLVPKDAGDNIEDYNKKRAEAAEENKRKIIGMFDKEKVLTNKVVADELGVSDETVVRYFDDLEREGKVKQVGKTGYGAHYVKELGE